MIKFQNDDTENLRRALTKDFHKSNSGSKVDSFDIVDAFSQAYAPSQEPQSDSYGQSKPSKSSKEENKSGLNLSNLKSVVSENAPGGKNSNSPQTSFNISGVSQTSDILSPPMPGKPKIKTNQE